MIVQEEEDGTLKISDFTMEFTNPYQCPVYKEDTIWYGSMPLGGGYDIRIHVRKTAKVKKEAPDHIIEAQEEVKKEEEQDA